MNNNFNIFALMVLFASVNASDKAGTGSTGTYSPRSTTSTESSTSAERKATPKDVLNQAAGVADVYNPELAKSASDSRFFYEISEFTTDKLNFVLKQYLIDHSDKSDERKIPIRLRRAGITIDLFLRIKLPSSLDGNSEVKMSDILSKAFQDPSLKPSVVVLRTAGINGYPDLKIATKDFAALLESISSVQRLDGAKDQPVGFKQFELDDYETDSNVSESDIDDMYEALDDGDLIARTAEFTKKDSAASKIQKAFRKFTAKSK